LPNDLEVVFTFENPMPDVMVDERQIKIAFGNLIRNARDAMPDGGSLTVGSKVSVSHVVFSIKDSGIGISRENLNNIVEPLFTTKARGMGLGLSITRAIVEKNQGSLSVDSEIGIGSDFRIDLNRGDIK
jgi:two-component system sensor kinase FixL